MKKWGLRILSATLTFTVGTFAAIFFGRCLKPALIQPVRVSPSIKLQTPPMQIEEDEQATNETQEDAQPTDEVEEDEPLPNEVYNPIQPRPVSISPYEIKSILDEDKLQPCQRGEYGGFLDFGHIWKRLKLKITDDSEFPNRCTSSAKAYIYTIELDGKSGDETLLKLDFGEPSESLYLVFKYVRSQHNAQWHLLGSIPYVYGAPFVPPSHKVISDGQHRWLVIDHSTGHGSAFGSGADNWFEVSESGVKKVLSYQNGLFIGLSNPNVDRRSKILKCEYRAGITTVIVQSSTSFEGYDKQTYEPFNLWSNKRKAVFIKRPGMKKLILDSRHSEMSAKEINPYYGVDADISNQDILKYNYRDLARIAAKGNEKQKEWLRGFLHVRNDSSSKQSLQKALEGM